MDQRPDKEKQAGSSTSIKMEGSNKNLFVDCVVDGKIELTDSHENEFNRLTREATPAKKSRIWLFAKWLFGICTALAIAYATHTLGWL